MTLPLYKALHDAPPKGDEIGHNGHKGLWFERFYNAYAEIPAICPKKDMSAQEKEALIQQEINWLKKFQKKAGKVGKDSALEAKAVQQMALCKALKGRTLFAKTQWHFVTGMGLSHPIENGMAWHPTLGVPYLTGAAVKGMLRAWIEVWDTNDDEQLQKERLQQWFGSDDKNGISTRAGSLIFFDALPTESPTLGIDIMTPHGGKWYAEGQLIEKSNDVKESEKLPADWHNPIPIPFLVVKHASLQFCVAPRNKKAAQEVDIDSVYHALQHALEWIGAGAKTAVGYGRFEIDIPREKDITDKKAQQLKAQQEKVDMEKAKAALSPLAYEFHQHAKKEQWEVNKDKFWQQGVMEGWLDRLEADPNAALRKTIEKLMNQYFKNVMDNPDAVKGRRKKPVHKKRVQTLAKRLIKLR